jgi:hypothetical protein
MMVDKISIEKALHFEPMQNLYDLTVFAKKSGTKTSGTTGKKPPEKPTPASNTYIKRLSSTAMLLAQDAIVNMDSQFSERKNRLGLSVRQIENAKRELINNCLIKEVWLGKSLMLAPTAKLYLLMGLEPPYKRNVSDIHSFLVLAAAKLIEPNPLLKYVKREVSLGDSNSTLDLLVSMKNGQRWAYEITVSQSNVAANIAKLNGKNFSRIYILCRDHIIRESAWATIRNAGFDPNFLSTIRCIIFSTLFHQKKQLILKEMR